MAEPTNIQVFNYKITGDPSEVDNGLHYSDALEELLQKTYFQVQKQKFKNPQWLHALIEKYPNVPAFKNYLTVFYTLKGNKEKAHSANHWCLREHPNYLHAKLNLAVEYIQTGHLDEVPNVLGQALDLQDLYPERKVFHITEFRSFLDVSCRYLIKKGELEAVEGRLEAAEKVLGKEEPSIQNLRILIEDARYEAAEKKREKMEEEQDGLKIGRGYDTSVQTDVAPTFHHPEILELYQHGLVIDHEVLRRILALPRQTLVQDLEKVLLDSLHRHEYFYEKNEEWEEEACSFAFHAMFLLTELRATEHLPTILHLLRQGEAYLEYWYSDHVTETLWQFVYHLGQGRLDLLKDFMLERDVYYLGKWVVISAVRQMAHHLPEKKQAALQWFEEVIKAFVQNHDDVLFADYKVASSMVCELADLRAAHLLPEIKQLYDLGLIDETLPGSYKAVETDIRMPVEEPFFKVFDNIFDHYDHIRQQWYRIYTPEERAAQEAEWRERLAEMKPPQAEDRKNYFSDPGNPVKKDTPKVGRNAPCPCGSGKKYKKCCM